MSERKRVDIKAILADPVLREEIVEGATDFICKVEGIRPHSFSPAAQAVLDAFAADNYGVWLEGDPERLAAALKAAADQLRNPYEVEDCDEFERGFKEAHILYRTQILAIAAELEAHS